MKKVFVDTNIFLRFLVDERSKDHKDCSFLFQAIESGKIKGVICSVVIMEILFTLKSFYRLPKKRCLEFLENILAINNLSMEDSYNYRKALELYKNTKAKFADCLIASLDFFEKQGVIVSYDKDFDKLDIKRLHPGKV